MNILLITSDQQHWSTVGKFNPEIKTPNLDRLCDGGIYFDRAYTVNPTCTPTRASIITGKYPSQHGAWTLGTKLSESEHTISEDLSSAGYRTALVGKAHFQQLFSTEKYPSLEAYPTLHDLDFWRGFNGPFYGFDHVELARNHTTESHVGQHYAIWMEEKGLTNWRDYFEPGMDKSRRRIWDLPEEYNYNTWIAERTNTLMEGFASNGENFFMWASFFDPHPPYYAPEPWASMYDPEAVTLPGIATGETERNTEFFKLTQEQQPDTSKYKVSGYGLHGVHSHLHDREELKKDIATYYGMTSLMDKYIGQILDKLESLGLQDDTLVVFTTDHGHFTGHHGLTAKGPFMFEDLIKVPFIVRCPGQKNKGTVNSSIQSLVDLAPTFLSMLGIDGPDGIAGIDQSDVWAGNTQDARKWAICEHHHEYMTVNVRTYVDSRYKISLYYGLAGGDLFDLQSDPLEINNLWNNPDYAGLKADLFHKFLLAEMEKEPRFMPRVAHA